MTLNGLFVRIELLLVGPDGGIISDAASATDESDIQFSKGLV